MGYLSTAQGVFNVCSTPPQNNVLEKTNPSPQAAGYHKQMNLPTQKECQSLFDEHRVPNNIREHCEEVRRVSLVIAQHVSKLGLPINTELVDRLAFLHDIFKMVTIRNFGSSIHEGESLSLEQIQYWTKIKEQFPGMMETEIAFEVFKEAYPQLAVILKMLSKTTIEDSWEQMIVHYSDFRVLKNRVVSIAERLAYLEKQYPRNPEWWVAYASQIVAIEEKIFAMLSFDPEELTEVVHSQLNIEMGGMCIAPSKSSS